MTHREKIEGLLLKLVQTQENVRKLPKIYDLQYPGAVEDFSHAAISTKIDNFCDRLSIIAEHEKADVFRDLTNKLHLKTNGKELKTLLMLFKLTNRNFLHDVYTPKEEQEPQFDSDISISDSEKFVYNAKSEELSDWTDEEKLNRPLGKKVYSKLWCVEVSVNLDESVFKILLLYKPISCINFQIITPLILKSLKTCHLLSATKT